MSSECNNETDLEIRLELITTILPEWHKAIFIGMYIMYIKTNN